MNRLLRVMRKNRMFRYNSLILFMILVIGITVAGFSYLSVSKKAQEKTTLQTLDTLLLIIKKDIADSENIEESLRDITDNYKNEYDIYIYFTDEQGNMTGDIKTASSKKIIKKIIEQEGKKGYRSNNKYVAGAYIPELDKYIIVENLGIDMRYICVRIFEYGLFMLLMMLILIVLFNYVVHIEEYNSYTKKIAVDKLVGIPDDASLIEKINDYLAGPDSKKKGAAMFVLDIDCLSEVENVLGKDKADQVLNDIAHIIMNTFRANDIVGRYDNDKFMAFCPGLLSSDTCILKASLLNEAARVSYSDSIGNSVNISLSIGIAVYPKHGDTYDELYKNAERALNFVRESSGDGYKLYSDLPNL
ncbi:MAG: GGDEF domain-containing protein [Butyrivibrio sp.]|nr:GGDEF domain-containing protein [Butyrivibrio sp.]